MLQQRTQNANTTAGQHSPHTRDSGTAARKSTRNQAAQADESEQMGPSDGVQAKGGARERRRTEQ